MGSQDRRYRERHGVKTKIIATVGPAVESLDMLRQLVEAGVDIFRLNFAHGSHEWLATVVARIRNISEELQQPLALLGDLSGPKIRLGELPDGEVMCVEGETFTFVEQAEPGPLELTSTYDSLIDDLSVGDSVLLADGTVRMVVTEKNRGRTSSRLSSGRRRTIAFSAGNQSSGSETFDPQSHRQRSRRPRMGRSIRNSISSGSASCGRPMMSNN